ncbi:transposase [Streptomyces sp. NPDC003247]|uniref:transposase n=1 Tax=Streptomyces sp. NPDC003247 TaxID=3364677 RepID=UPI00369190C8
MFITKRTGLPLSVVISGGEPARQPGPDSSGERHTADPPRHGRRRRKPGKLHADKGYDYNHLRRWLRQRGITHRIAREGIESSQRLSRRRWTIERTMSWLAGCRRLHRHAQRSGQGVEPTDILVGHLPPCLGGRSVLEDVHAK